MTSSWRGAAPGGGMPGNGPRGADGSCCSVRYLSTKPAMPRSLSHSATLTPSLSKPSTRSAPPGAITAAAPVATLASGRNTVSVGSLTFAITRSPDGELVTDSGIDQCSEPGAPSGQRRISVCARTGATEESAMPAQRTKWQRRTLIVSSRRPAQRRDRKTRRSRARPSAPCCRGCRRPRGSRSRNRPRA